MSQKKKTWLVLALALLCGGTAAYLALGYIRAQAAPVFAPSATQQVAVAAQDLPIGTLLQSEHVRLVKWPGDALPQGYYGSVAEVVGRGLTTPIRTNEPLIAGKVAGKGEGGGLPILIPDGMRALSISVSDVVAVAGFVIPGSRVDILLTLDQSGEQHTRVFMQNMTVLAANQSIVKDEEGKPMSVGIVTFLVTPEQAEKITLATTQGQFQLALRNRVDVDQVDTRGARRADLGAVANRPSSASPVTARRQSRPEPRETVVEMYRGGVRTLSTFSNGN